MSRTRVSVGHRRIVLASSRGGKVMKTTEEMHYAASSSEGRRAYAGVEADGLRIDAGAGELDQLLKFDRQRRHDDRVADNQIK